MNAVAMQQQLDDLSRQARHHKRKLRAHRQALRECSAKLAELKAACDRYGIAFNPPTSAEESHGSTEYKSRRPGRDHHH